MFAIVKSDGFFGHIKEIHQEEIVSVDHVEQIEISGSFIDMDVTQTDKEEIQLVLSGKVSSTLEENVQLIVIQNGSTLKIEAKLKNRNWMTGFNRISLNLQVKIPVTFNKDILIKSSSGDICLENIHLHSVYLQASSGDIHVNEVNVKNTLKTKVSSGDINIVGVKAHLMSHQSTSGDVEVRKSMATIIRGESTSGDMNVHDCIGKLEASSTSGDVEIELSQLIDDMELKSTSGDIKVDLQHPPENVEVVFKSSSGDGRVKIQDLHYEVKKNNQIIGFKGLKEPKIEARTSSGDFILR
jgi:lia operon protein LiaG